MEVKDDRDQHWWWHLPSNVERRARFAAMSDREKVIHVLLLGGTSDHGICYGCDAVDGGRLEDHAPYCQIFQAGEALKRLT